MKCYQIDGFNITADNESQAKKIFDSINEQLNRSIIFIPKDGSPPKIIELNQDCEFDICVQVDKSVSYVGSLSNGNGFRLMQSAIDSIDSSKRVAGKLANLTRRNKSIQRQADIENCLDDYEKTIPFSLKMLYDEVIQHIGATTDAYKLDMYEKLNREGIIIQSENWLPILDWFKTKVIDIKGVNSGELATSFQLRASFVTAAITIVGQGARSSNTMSIAKGVNNNFDWSDYAEKNKK